MRKMLILPLLLPVIGAAATYGYYWYQIKDHAARLATELAPFGVLDYETVVAGFDGVAGIESVSFRPLGQDVELTARRLVVETGSWTDFITLSQSDSGQLPLRVAVRLEGLDIDLRALPAVAGGNQGCQSAAASGASLWRALGYQRLQANLSAGYDYSPDHGYLKLNLKMDAPSAFKVNLSGSLAVGPVTPKLTTLISQSRLSEVGVLYQDDSYNARLRRYCAEQSGLPEELYVTQLTHKMAARYQQLGWQIGEPLLEAYRGFMLSQGMIDARLVAKTPLPLLGLSNAQLDDFSTRLTVNRQPVQPLTLSWQPALFQPGAANGSGLMKTAVASPQPPIAATQTEPAVSVPGGSPSPLPAPATQSVQVAQSAAEEKAEALQLTPVKRSKRSEYREIQIEELEQHLGKALQVDTRNGHRIEGVLEELVRGQLRVRQEMDGGVAVLPIRFDLINRVRVKD